MHANKLKSPITRDVYQLAVEMCRLFCRCSFLLCAVQNLQKKGLTDLQQTVSRLKIVY
jgi:hypothetical protein